MVVFSCYYEVVKKNSNNMNFFKNKDGKWAVIQFPNFLLMAWLFLTLALLLIGESNLKDNIHQLSSALLFAWAYLEVTKGDSPFRRLLGGVVLLSVIYNYF